MLSVILDEANQVGVDPAQTQESGGGRRYESAVSLPSALLLFVMEPVQKPEHRRGRRHAATALLAPSPKRLPLPSSIP